MSHIHACLVLSIKKLQKKSECRYVKCHVFPDCGMCFLSVKGMEVHARQCNPDVVGPNGPPPAVGFVRCPICQNKFTSFQNVERHRTHSHKTTVETWIDRKDHQIPPSPAAPPLPPPPQPTLAPPPGIPEPVLSSPPLLSRVTPPVRTYTRKRQATVELKVENTRRTLVLNEEFPSTVVATASSTTTATTRASCSGSDEKIERLKRQIFDLIEEDKTESRSSTSEAESQEQMHERLLKESVRIGSARRCGRPSKDPARDKKPQKQRFENIFDLDDEDRIQVIEAKQESSRYVYSNRRKQNNRSSYHL